MTHPAIETADRIMKTYPLPEGAGAREVPVEEFIALWHALQELRDYATELESAVLKVYLPQGGTYTIVRRSEEPE